MKLTEIDELCVLEIILHFADHELQKYQMSLFAYFMNRTPRRPFSPKDTLKMAIDNLNDLECALFEVFWSSFDQMVFLRI